MRKQRNKDKDRDKDKDKAPLKQKTDAEILQDRRRQEAFEVADLYQRMVGRGFCIAAVAWFLFLSEVESSLPSIHNSSCNAAMSLLVCGDFCIRLSRSVPPKGHWPRWRHHWHTMLLIASAAMAGGFVLALRRQASMAALVRQASLMPCRALAVSCGAAALTAVFVYPERSSEGSAAKPQGTLPVFLGRVLFCVDGVACLALGAIVLYGAPWDEPLGPATALTTVVPQMIAGLGMMNCQRDQELLAAVWAAMIFFVCTVARAVVSQNALEALPVVFLFVLHVGLFLPFPAEEPMKNPFNMALRRACRDFGKMMANPVPSFGDED